MESKINQTCIPVQTETTEEGNLLDSVIESSVKFTKKSSFYRCKICRKTFRNNGSFQTHAALHRIKSKSNKNKFQKYFVLQNEEKKIARRYFLCRICDSKHHGLEALLDHQKIHHENEDNEINFPSQMQQELQVQQQSQGQSQNKMEADHMSYENQFKKPATEIDLSDNVNEGMENNRAILNEANELSAESLTHIPLTETTVSLIAALCSSSSASQAPSTLPKNHLPTTQPVDSIKTVSSNDGVHLEIPSQVKSIYLNCNNPNIGDVMKELQVLNRKFDILMKHLNIPVDEDGHIAAPLATDTIEVQASNEQQMVDSEETVILEGYPPSYSIVQAAKEQQQQEYYALTLSSRQAQQILKTESPQILNASAVDIKNFQKAKGMDLWVPSQQYLAQLPSFSESEVQEEPNHQQQQQQQQQPQNTFPQAQIDNTTINMISNNIVDKIFIESRSRANFAKNLTFSIFSQEERRGKNCTGRVFGKAQHKGQLDQVKLQAVKEATFRKYPCSAHLVDITWKKECITAIDSGLRNENRTNRASVNVQMQHHHLVVEEAAVATNKITDDIMETA